MRLESNFANPFNHATATNDNVRYSHANNGQVQFAREGNRIEGFDCEKLMKDQKCRMDPRFNLRMDFLVCGSFALPGI